MIRILTPGYYIYPMNNSFYVLEVPKEKVYRGISRPLESYEKAIEYIEQLKIVEERLHRINER